LHLSKKLIPITVALNDSGLVDLAKGSYAGPGAKSNRTTRIRASRELQNLFQEAKFQREDVHRFTGEEIIILRDEKEAGKVGKEVEYDDTPSTIAMRDELKAYNDLLAHSFIDVATQQEPVIWHEDTEIVPVQIHSDHSRLRRVFSRKDWTMNGRFYGGWWQQVNEDWRSKIFINDQPTIEVDFKGLHIAMLYAQTGSKMEHDPYDIPSEGLMSYPAELRRKLVKRLALTAINAKEKTSAYRAFRDGFPTSHVGKTITDKKLDRLLGAFLSVNSALEGLLFSDQGIKLMYQDSQITARVHNHFTEQGVPVLSVHDSYIIDHMKVAELRTVMAAASREVTGHALPTAIKLPDMEEYADVSDKQLQTHIENRQGLRCEGYMNRLFAYQDRTGHVIAPVARGDDETEHFLGSVQ
jgi:hypothetical protein